MPGVGCTKGEYRYPPCSDFFKLFKTCSSNWQNPYIVQHCRVEVTFHLLSVLYLWWFCFLCLPAAAEKSLSGG